MSKIYLDSNTCQLRALDLERLKKYFIKNGHEIVDSPEKSDKIVYLTCGARPKNIDICIDRIKHYKTFNSELIVGGCLPTIDKEKVKSVFKGKIINTKDLDRKPENIDKIFPEHPVNFSLVEDGHLINQNFLTQRPIFKKLRDAGIIPVFGKILKKFPRLKKFYQNFMEYVVSNYFGLGEGSIMFSGKKIYNVRPSWGCLGNCSYCVIKDAVGSIHSKPIEDCVKELKEGLEKGYKEIVINADDTGAYGRDIGETLPHLLDKLTEIDEDYQIFLLDLNPGWAVKYGDELIDIFKRKKITLASIPIQAGNSRILKLMQRYSNVEKIKETMKKIKEAAPGIIFTTFIIEGFPTEKREEFQDTLDFIIDTDINNGIIFPYANNKIAAAEKIEPKISTEEKQYRLKYAKKFFRKNGYSSMYFKSGNYLVFGKKSK